MPTWVRSLLVGIGIMKSQNSTHSSDTNHPTKHLARGRLSLVRRSLRAEAGGKHLVLVMHKFLDRGCKCFHGIQNPLQNFISERDPWIV